MGNRAAAAVASLDPYAQQLLARATSVPAYDRIKLIDDTISMLRWAEIWDGLDGLYVLAGYDAQSTKLNWRKPAFDLTAVGTTTFTTDRGYAGDGSTGYLDVDFIPSSDAEGWTLNSASISIWSRSASPSSQRAAGTAFGGNISLASGQLRSTINTDGAYALAVSVPDNTGLMTASRTAADLTTGYRNGVSLGTAPGASTTVCAGQFAVLASYQGGGGVTTFWNGQAALVAWGAGRTAAKEAAFAAIMTNYMQKIGAA